MIPGANMALGQDLSKTSLSLFHWCCSMSTTALHEDETLQIWPLRLKIVLGVNNAGNDEG